MMKLSILFLISITLSCSNPNEEKEKTMTCDDPITSESLYAFLKPNGIEMKNRWCNTIYYVLTDSMVTNFEDVQIGEKINDRLKPDESRVISHNNYVPGDERYIYWWTDAYQSEDDVNIVQLH